MDAEKDSLRLHTYLKEYKQRAFREKNDERISAYYKNFVFQQKAEERLVFIDSALPYAFKTKDKAVIGDVYLTKGTLFYSMKDFQKALDNYLKANGYISQTDDVYNKKRIKYKIGIVKNYLGYYADAASLFQECIDYYSQDETYNMQRGYVSSLEGLAWSYTKMNRVKKSNQVLQTALRSVEKNNFSKLDEHYLVFKQGINDYFLKNYSEGIRKIEQKIPFLYENEDFAWATVGNFYIGQSYWDMNEKEKAISYFEKVNQVFETKKYTHPDVRKSYELLISHYKSKNDKNKQLYYIEQLVKADSIYSQNHKHLIHKIHKEYETKDLLQVKKELERSLFVEKYKTGIISGVAFLILIVSLVVYFQQNKKAKKVAQELIRKIESMQKQIVASSEELKIIPKTTNSINDEIVLKILEKLTGFEQKQKFLKPDVTLEKVAKEFGTNTTYLSSVINSHKNQKFNDYVNSLRINYLTKEMVTNSASDFFKYSMDGIAKHLGFKNEDTFSRVFYKHTGIKPSVFIKELLDKRYLMSA
ncbi:helix-turn-helix domain-containing protein [Flavobacterium solisilvae]|uniref:Helix-turn-helix domain-containing protein n=1 Tax=Flavobacterium solisilvae TaxID=1852019 RepID=A0ABX1QSF8_9FLAO|nr:helix-turn-helix domain-containing protein [Flavobacterium solisilvae]NMH24385.1 helix-turn-helix domain-containing protein [Flavobacterium solisilvae]